jgi:hypothetical protein
MEMGHQLATVLGLSAMIVIYAVLSRTQRYRQFSVFARILLTWFYMLVLLMVIGVVLFIITGA